jgi:micrococcal nuclease
MLRGWLVCILLSLSATAALACDFGRGEAVIVEDAIAGDRVRLKDGRDVQLIGIHAPQPAIALAGPEPFADKARAALSKWTKGQSVKLQYAGPKRVDRYGRVLAQLEREDGLWLQARLVEAGLARVSGALETRRCLADLLLLEEKARASHRGLWALPYYAPLKAEDLKGLMQRHGSFQLVEGKINRIALIRKRLYLNFGNDWKTDFTVAVEPAELRYLLTGDTAEPNAKRLEAFRALWEGKQVRVRGWIEKYYGPQMRMDYPEQMQLIETPLKQKKKARSPGL